MTDTFNVEVNQSLESLNIDNTISIVLGIPIVKTIDESEIVVGVLRNIDVKDYCGEDVTLSCIFFDKHKEYIKNNISFTSEISSTSTYKQLQALIIN